jgi:hypothetical protein
LKEFIDTIYLTTVSFKAICTSTKIVRAYLSGICLNSGVESIAFTCTAAFFATQRQQGYAKEYAGAGNYRSLCHGILFYVKVPKT